MLELLNLGVAFNKKKTNKIDFTARQEQMLLEKAGKVPVIELEELLGKSSGTLYRKAKELGVDIASLFGYGSSTSSSRPDSRWLNPFLTCL